MNDDFIDPENLSRFNLPESIISQLFEFTGSSSGDSGFILSFVNQDGLPSIITKANSPIVEMGLKKSFRAILRTSFCSRNRVKLATRFRRRRNP